MKKIAIMQPYFFPYLGYWQLINSVDEFVVYDNIQYTKKGWFNRNNFLQNGKAKIFSIPLKKDSSYLNVDKRYISPDFNKNRLIAQLENAYHKAPYYKENFNLIKDIINFDNDNLFNYIYNSIVLISNYLGIETNIIISSEVNIDHNLKSQDKVIAICKELGATNYINSIGGKALYSKFDFQKENIILKFLQKKDIIYNQFNNEFVDNLSIIDVMMFNSPKTIRSMLDGYILQ